MSTAGETNVVGSELQTAVRKWGMGDTKQRPYTKQDPRAHVCCLMADDARKSGNVPTEPAAIIYYPEEENLQIPPKH